jgi:hypothetical protein
VSIVSTPDGATREEAVVLSERERRILDVIEAGIVQESPRLARKLRAARLDDCLRCRRYDVTVLCSLAISLGCLLFGRRGALAAAGVAAELAVVTTVARHKLLP